MSKRYAQFSSAASAAVLAATLGATSTLAATTWTVKPGGAVSAKSGVMTIRDARTGSIIRCQSSSMKATLTSGTGLSGTGIGSISSFTFSTCIGALGIQYTLKTSHLPFAMNAASYNSKTVPRRGRSPAFTALSRVRHARLYSMAPGPARTTAPLRSHT